MFKKLTLVVLILSSLVISGNQTLKSQTLPVITNESGDTLHYTWPIPDSLLCIKDEIIIKFKKNALFLNKLCYTYINPYSYGDSTELNYFQIQKSEMMLQQFPIDTLIADVPLREAIRSFGGLYLTRITAANPCTDTLSITRLGDTIECENYLWMKLKLNNNTSLITACLALTIYYQNVLEEAEPNFCGHFNVIPSDTYYNGPESKRQQSFYPEYSDVQTAWDFQRGGSYNIKIGIIDDGIDFTHCDLGAGTNIKVIDGWDYASQRSNFSLNSTHGTPIAGIIGALSNGSRGCLNQQGLSESGVAGIVGGWYTGSNWTKANLGCQLFGFKVDIHPDDQQSVDKVIGAIRDASALYKGEDGNVQVHSSYGVHVINCSWGYSDIGPIPSLRRAFNFAFEHGVSIVTSMGNDGKISAQYPANFEPSWITSVGAHDIITPPSTLPIRLSSSNYGNNMDFLAPGALNTIYTTSYTTVDYKNTYANFQMTSAAAAHVSGAIGLLRSQMLNYYTDLEPEDYENMLKAAAMDLNYDPNNLDINKRTQIGYDKVTGWGMLKISRIFQMLQAGYIIEHHTISIDPLPQYPFDDFDIEILKEGKRNDCPEGQYNVRRRTITGYDDLGTSWLHDDINKLYVWGRNGRTLKGGLGAQSGMLFLTSYSEVTSGEMGNGIVPGIVHNNNQIVHAKTYQYELRDLKTKTRIQDLPTNENLEIYITVFGKKRPVSVNDFSFEGTNTLKIIPNPASSTFSIQFKLDFPIKPVIKIYNYLGTVIYEDNSTSYTSEYYDKIINSENFEPGMYTVEVNQGNKIARDKLIIVK